MTPVVLYVQGVGVWSPWLADQSALAAVLGGKTPERAATKPAAARLPPNERRRAPAGVRLAVEVASQAVAMGALDPATLACVFASVHGDEAVTDAMCATLARAPAELSPTLFHNSVHNAAVGYWTIAVGCRAPSTALAAGDATFGAGLLEAASQAAAEACPVLFVCSDTEGAGPLGAVTGSADAFGCALALTPTRGAHALARLDLAPVAAPAPTPLPEPLATWRARNASAQGLALLALLAVSGGRCVVPAAPAIGLRIDVERLA